MGRKAGWLNPDNAMRSYPVIYHDKRGVEKAIIKSDGNSVHLTLRGIDFEGGFEDFEGRIDQSKFDYTPYDDGTGTLTNFVMEVQMAVLFIEKSGEQENTHSEVIRFVLLVGDTTGIESINLGTNTVELHANFGSFTSAKKIDWFENTLADLQEKLPKNIYLKTCISCKYSNYHPVGNGMFASLCCFRNFKKELLEIKDKHNLMRIWTAEAVQKEELFFVQETFDCPEHQLPTKDDWYYKDWAKTIES